MLPRRAVLGTMLVACLAPHLHGQQAQSAPPNTPTFKITSNLVYLDVTVLDKKGHVVTSGLTRDDFSITEDNQPERIFSFEPPRAHSAETAGGSAETDSGDGRAPKSIIVLDLLNSSWQQLAHTRVEMLRFLKAQPDRLASPTELMVLRNHTLQRLQGFTRSRSELLDALRHLKPELPFKRNRGEFFGDIFVQSTGALQQIAIECQGIPGRKNVYWIGPGGPPLYLSVVGNRNGPKFVGLVQSDVHLTTNLLVKARITLYLIDPGLHVQRRNNMTSFDPIVSDLDPFAADVSFANFVNTTGGKLTFNRNFSDKILDKDLPLGSEYYTLTYQPHRVPDDGSFRVIRVAVRNLAYHVLTKTGYYAPEPEIASTVCSETQMTLSAAFTSTVPLNVVPLSLEKVVRHPDADTVTVTVLLSLDGLRWEPDASGGSRSNVIIAAASMDKGDNVLAARLEPASLISHDANPRPGKAATSALSITVPIPRKTEHVRIVAQREGDGGIGSVDLTERELAHAPEAPSAAPNLETRTASMALPTGCFASLVNGPS